MKSEFVTWTFLTTYAGAVAMVMVILQFIKGIKWIDKLPRQPIAYFIALIILLLSTLFTDGLHWDNTILAMLNAFIVAAAALGGQTAVHKLSGQKNKDKKA